MYYQQILGQKMNKKTGASSIYLREEEYRKVVVPWMSNRPEAYAAWCGVWASEAFQQKSKSHRDNRGTMPNHTFGGDNFTRKAKRLEAQLGREPTPIEVWEAGHRGSDPSNPLCSQTQRERLAAYAEEMKDRHGEDCDWRTMPIDAQAVHKSGGGKAHGRFSLFDGMINTTDFRASRRSASGSGSSGRSSHREAA
ncbi:uncharacterized protein [Zea mays]|uniref:uncharacterized protein n=1 Tax=Zea mays TaxID=4577 RepID=UPI0016525C08|nr:uncharacterized protein LOC109944515 [Zea mays]